MIGHKQILCVLLFTILSTLAIAQNNTNSPYTRYGYGQLSDHNSAKNKAMGGIGYAVRDGLQLNLLNPASYSAVDSLTLLFEGGITLQNTNFSNGTTKLNAKNSSFDYVAMQLRLRPKLGLTMGLLPFSNVGYNLSSIVTDTEAVPNIITYSGDGGLQEAFLGLGYSPLKGLSIGANVSYIWGDINRSTALSFPNNTTFYGYEEINSLSVSDFKFDFGAQYTHRLTKKSALTLGLVYAPAVKLSNDATLVTQQSTSSSYISTTTKDIVADFGIGAKYGGGATYVYDNRLTVGLDYTLEKWSKERYLDDPNSFNDRQKIALGLEYLPSYTGHNYLSVIKYRIGAYYSKPYYKIKINDDNGYGSAKEYGVSAGLALPVPRVRSIINITAQYVRVSGAGKNLLDENYMRVCIGLTFNERWFFKQKVE